jgi:hypothetical protein
VYPAPAEPRKTLHTQVVECISLNSSDKQSITVSPSLSFSPKHHQQQHTKKALFMIPSTTYSHSLLSLSLGRCIPVDIRPALLLRPELLVVRLGVDLELREVGVDDFLAAVGALEPQHVVSACTYPYPYPYPCPLALPCQMLHATRRCRTPPACLLSSGNSTLTDTPNVPDS